MYQLIVLFFQICLLRKGPEDVPANPWCLWLIFPVFLLNNLLILLVSNSWSTALLQTAVNILMIIGFSWPLLFFADKRSRFPQTLAALIGSDAMISFFAIPAVVGLTTEASGLAYFSMLALMIWHWLVSGHIYRHALDRPLFFGLGLALLYILISSQVMAALFPVLSTPY